MDAMRLAELIGSDWTGRLSEAERAIDITGLALDSRRVEPGYLFAALPGVHAHGASFIPEAVARGAAAILGPPDAAVQGPRPVILRDRNPRRRLALLAARFHAPQPETVVAVTGTNGKTSVAVFLRQIWEALGHKAASVGTLGVLGAGFDEPFGLTTPDPIQLHTALRRLKDAGIEHVAMETSSHGLAQHRVDGVTFSAAALTNITRDHLDYHGSIEAYVYAKLRLFGEVLAPGRAAILNADAAIAGDAEALCWARGHRVFTVGRLGRDLTLEACVPTAAGQRLSLRHDGRSITVDLPLAGLFQASNALLAAGLAIATGGAPVRVLGALATLKGPPGRLERVAVTPGGSSIFVDYAHTPDAVKTVLEALRPHTAGRLHIVFGCGGDRDRGKRPEMGRIAAALADRVIVTDDNPRTEDAALIRAAILAAAPGAEEIADRGEAIAHAIAGLAPGDILVVAGKGHEQGQIVGATLRPFSDHGAIRTALGVRGGGS